MRIESNEYKYIYVFFEWDWITADHSNCPAFMNPCGRNRRQPWGHTLTATSLSDILLHTDFPQSKWCDRMNTIDNGFDKMTRQADSIAVEGVMCEQFHVTSLKVLFWTELFGPVIQHAFHNPDSLNYRNTYWTSVNWNKWVWNPSVSIT